MRSATSLAFSSSLFSAEPSLATSVVSASVSCCVVATSSVFPHAVKSDIVVVAASAAINSFFFILFLLFFGTKIAHSRNTEMSIKRTKNRGWGPRFKELYRFSSVQLNQYDQLLVIWKLLLFIMNRSFPVPALWQVSWLIHHHTDICLPRISIPVVIVLYKYKILRDKSTPHLQ